MEEVKERMQRHSIVARSHIEEVVKLISQLAVLHVFPGWSIPIIDFRSNLFNKRHKEFDNPSQ